MAKRKITEPPVLELDDIELYYLLYVSPPYLLDFVILEHMVLMCRYFLTAGLSEEEAKAFLGLIDKYTTEKKEKEKAKKTKKKKAK